MFTKVFIIIFFAKIYNVMNAENWILFNAFWNVEEIASWLPVLLGFE